MKLYHRLSALSIVFENLHYMLLFLIFRSDIIALQKAKERKMIIYINRSTDPYFNMATEEFLLRKAQEPTVMLWRNEPAVIIGKNQNAGENVSFDFTRANGIKVVRRLTGGGAVFHDLGNVNYTFIMPESDAPDSFSEFSEPVIRAIRGLSINAEASGRNDLLAEGKKFSGTARCGYKRDDGSTVIMHHGTLLFSADMSRLSGALITDPEKVKSKGIKSTAARVINLCELLPDDRKDMTAEGFMKYLERFFVDAEGATEREFSEADKAEIQKLSEEKYSTEKWLLRAGADDFDTEKKRRFDFGTVKIRLRCRAGEVGMPAVIEKVRIEGDFIGDCDISGLEDALCGKYFEKNAVFSLLEESDVVKYVRGADATALATLIFE